MQLEDVRILKPVDEELGFDVGPQLRQEGVKVLARAVRIVQVAVTDDSRRTWFDVVNPAQGRDEFRQRFQLRFRRDFLIEVPCYIDTDGMVIFPIGVGTDCSQGTAPFDEAVLADDVVIANTGPAVGQMRPVNGRSRRIAIRHADVVDDDRIGLRPSARVR